MDNRREPRSNTTTSRTSILDDLGGDIIRIVTPVTISMFSVVLLVLILNSAASSSSSSILTLISDSTTSSDASSFWDTLTSSLLTALIFVAAVTVATFVLLLLFYLRCSHFLKLYTSFAAFFVLAFLGGDVFLTFLSQFSIPLDAITFSVVVLNFSVVGAMSVFLFKMPISVTQSYLVAVAVISAYWFTQLPEWTTWAVLIAMSLYDLAAVLLPVGPLRLLLELAISRDEDIPALVYEARPVSSGPDSAEVLAESGIGGSDTRRRWKRQLGQNQSPDSAELNQGLLENEQQLSQNLNSTQLSEDLVQNQQETETRVVIDDVVDILTTMHSNSEESGFPTRIGGGELVDEGIGLGSSGAIKLGLGDFVFYGVLVGRAAMYDCMTVYACYLAIMAGLGATLFLLAVYRKALPALPVSILLGISFYFLTRYLLENFVFQCSMNLMLF